MKRYSGLKCLAAMMMYLGMHHSALAETPFISHGQLNEEGTFQLTGRHFDIKEQAAPVLADYAEVAYENGIENAYFGNFSDFQPIVRQSVDPNSLYEKSSTAGATGDYLLFSRSRPGRTAHSVAHYYAASRNAFIGWPVAYGGSNTPVDNSQLFVSWWFKIKHDPRYYWEFPVENLTGGFNPKPGNILSTSFGTQGYVVNYSGTLVAIYQGELNSNKLRGATVTDLTDGGTAMLSNTGYISPGSNKYIRIWENPDGNSGVRISWTQDQVNGLWARADVIPEIWHHLEIELDTDRDFFKAYINGQLVGQTIVDYVGGTGQYGAYSGQWSPTVALLGYDGKQYHQEFEIDDIYMDKTLQRVILSNASELDQVSYYEVQRPIGWTDTSVNFSINYGALDKIQPIYAYVYNKAGVANPLGYEIKNKPKSPCLRQLKVSLSGHQTLIPILCN